MIKLNILTHLITGSGCTEVREGKPVIGHVQLPGPTTKMWVGKVKCPASILNCPLCASEQDP